MVYSNLLGQVRVGVRSGRIPTIVSLLDSYTGSAVGYSLRKLWGTYSGPAIRVRRSNDNSELDINFKTDGTLDTQSMIDFTNTPGPTSSILDIYSNSTAAFSLRKMSATYSGSAIRVRRTPDDAEMDISFNADGSLDTTTMLSFVNETIPTPSGYLLDNYTSAGIGLSLRRLSSTYSGSAIRVRRSSDNQETDIGFNAGGDLDTTSLLSFTGTYSAFVKTWYDQSGNARNLTQTTSSLQPQIVSAGVVNTQFGKPALKCFFGGTAHYLTGTLNVNYSNVGIISVTKPASAGTYGDRTYSIVFIGPDTGWGGVYQTSYYTATRFRFGSGYSGTDTQSPTLTNYGMANGCITSTFKSGTTETARVNGFDVINITAVGNTVRNTGSSISVGAGEGGTAYYGDISELVIYAGVDRSGSRHLIERHMNTYYSAFAYETKNLYVSKWYDQSGGLRHATNISMYHPLIVNNGVLYTSFGKPSINFSNTKNPLTYLTSTLPSINITQMSIISVSKTTLTGFGVGNTSLLHFDEIGGWGMVYQAVSTSSIGYRFGGGNSVAVQTGSGGSVNGTIFGIYKNSNQEISRANGLDRTTYTSPFTTIANTSNVMKIGMGQTSAYTGDISEIIVYYSNRINDRVNMETNLNIYYNVYKNSAYIKNWYDQSGNGRHLQQSSASNQPTIINAGTVSTYNNKPVVLFNGTSDYLTYIGNLPIGATLSLFSIIKKVTSNVGGFFTLTPASGNDYSTLNGKAFWHGNSAGIMTIESQTIGLNYSFNIPSYENYLFSAIQRGGTFSTRVNNSDLINVTYTGTPTNPNGLAVGARYVNSGYSYLGNSMISELMIYPTDQTLNRKSIENNMNSYYFTFDNIVTSNMVLNLDAGNTASYPGSGNTWYDLASANNGTLVNGPTYNSTNGGSLLFNGTNQYVNLGNVQSLNSITSGISIGAWIKSSTTPTYSAIVQKWYQSGLQGGFQLFVGPSNILKFAIGDFIGGYSTLTSTANVITGSWIYVSVTYDMNNVNFYINGVLNSTSTLVKSVINSNNATLYVGQDDYGGRFFKGNISLVSVYNRALSATEVLQNYNQTRSRYNA